MDAFGPPHFATSLLMRFGLLMQWHERGSARAVMSMTVHRIARLLAATTMLALVGCTSTRNEPTAGEYVSDKLLSSRVNHALNNQPVYKFPDIKVSASAGVVQLNGFVPSEQQREAATEIARGVRGVSEVRNDIRLGSLAPIDRTAVRESVSRDGGD